MQHPSSMLNQASLAEALAVSGWEVILITWNREIEYSDELARETRQIAQARGINFIGAIISHRKY